MKHYTLAYSDTGILSPILKDYLEACDCQQQFYKYPFDISSIPQVIADKQQENIDRKLLVAQLQQQYEGLKVSEATAANIKSLINTKTFTVTTAHQPNVFTGFLYYTNKILGAIKTAEVLNEHYPDYHFVPVYWIGSEDHDFEEINHINLFGEKIEWHNNEHGPVGHMNPNTLQAQIGVIAEKLGDMPYAEALIELFTKAYTGHKTLAEATTYLVNELFGQYGLVVMDQDRKAYKEKFKHVIKDELQNNRVGALLNDTIEQLNACNYKIQANPREINLFYFKPGLRERIVWNDDTNRYEVLNTELQFSKEDMLAEVDIHPECFSPNVFLRPLFQESLLPNVAYVGGGGEVAYWLELKRIFDHYQVNYPMLMLRNIAGIMDKTACKKMEKLGLNKKDLFIEEETLIKRYVKEHTNQSLELAQEKEDVEQLYARIQEKAISVDPTLERTVEGQKQGQLNALAGLEAKILRAEKKNFDIAVNQIRSVKGRLFPNGKLMERIDNFIPFYAKYGPAYFDEVKNAFNPFGKEFTLFFEE